jgi:hypothetical protein
MKDYEQNEKPKDEVREPEIDYIVEPCVAEDGAFIDLEDVDAVDLETAREMLHETIRLEYASV